MARSMHDDSRQMPDFLTEGIMRIALKPAIGATMIALAAMSGAASAAPLDTLYFTQTSGFSNPVTEFNGGPQGLTLAYNGPIASPPGSTNTVEQLAWTSNHPTVGNGNTSSLTIESYDSSSSPNADVDGWNAGDWFRIDKLFQENQVLAVPSGVANPNPLWIANILGNFRVFSDAGFSTLLKDDLDSVTTVKYWETSNTAGCSGSPNPVGSVCDDIYTVMELSLAPISFILDGYKYEISFRLEPGATTLICDGSPVPACLAEAGAQPGAGELFKVYAAEGFDSEIFVAAAWTATKIPEPGVLGLLGIGLMGMGLSARRRKATAA